MSTTDPFAGVPDPLRIALHDRGFTKLTAVQQAVLESDSEGHDLRISSQTGSGKTVALGFALAQSLLAEPKRKSKPKGTGTKAPTKPASESTEADASVADEPPVAAEAAAPSEAAAAVADDASQGEPSDATADENEAAQPTNEAEAEAEAEAEPEAVVEVAPEPALPKRAGPTCLIITPTRELATQVRDELRWLFAELPRTKVEVVTGGTDIGGERRMLRKIPRILVGTPGRLLDHMRNGAVHCDRVEHVVLDEADRMLEMGFREELDAIIDALPKARRSHLVSATFSADVRRVADRFQSKVLHLEGTALGEANEDIEHIAQLVPLRQRYGALVNALMLALGEQVLVFVDRRSDASDMAEALAGDGFAAMPFSGDLSQAQRTRTLHAFRSHTIQVLVCTDVAARGIDVPDISMVVHMSPPRNPDDYTHRSGRTGRAGRRGRSLLLVPPHGQHYVRRLLSAARIEVSWQAAPTPKKVRRAVTKRTRRHLHERLDGPTEPLEKTLEYATALLEGRDAAVIVATLLEMAEPRLPREPAEVDTIQPGTDDGRSDRRYDDNRGPRKRDRHRGGPPVRRKKRWQSRPGGK